MPSNTPPTGPIHSNYVPDEIRPYKRVDNIDLNAHIFLPENPAGTRKHSVLAFFHPGGWTMGEPAWGYDLCRRYASFGMVAISFQYRLSSIGGYTPADAISDARSAIRWTRQQEKELNIDPDRIVAGGISAGAHLAACAAILQGHDDNGDDLTFNPAPNALVLQSACLNSVMIYEFSRLLQGRDDPENCSPAHHIKPGLPPMCLIHGTADEIIPYDSIKDFTDRMLEAGNRCELHPFEGTDHFFINNPNGSRVLEIIDEFLMSLDCIDMDYPINKYT